MYQNVCEWHVILSGGSFLAPDGQLDAHILADHLYTAEQVFHVLGKEMTDVTDAETVRVQYLAWINHLIWNKKINKN